MVVIDRIHIVMIIIILLGTTIYPYITFSRSLDSFSLFCRSSKNESALFHLFGLFDSRGTLGKSQRSPVPIAKGKDLSIVVNVMGVMDGMILAAHDGIDVPVHGIVDIGCPYGGKKDHAQMGQVVARNKGQEVHIRTGLQNSVERVKGHRCPGRKCFGLVVIVVLQVNVFVQKLVCVKGAVHPVDADFDAEKVKGHCGNVVLPSTNFLNRVVNLCVTRFDQVFVQDGQHGVKGH